MRISRDIRDAAEREAGMAQMSETFKESGGTLYLPAK